MIRVYAHYEALQIAGEEEPSCPCLGIPLPGAVESKLEHTCLKAQEGYRHCPRFYNILKLCDATADCFLFEVASILVEVADCWR